MVSLQPPRHIPTLPRRWMAARMGERGGRVRSAAKRTASRENGKLGGRPRKAAQS
jgi:hypothetical protein